MIKEWFTNETACRWSGNDEITTPLVQAGCAYIRSTGDIRLTVRTDGSWSPKAMRLFAEKLNEWADELDDHLLQQNPTGDGK